MSDEKQDLGPISSKSARLTWRLPSGGLRPLPRYSDYAPNRKPEPPPAPPGTVWPTPKAEQAARKSEAKIQRECQAEIEDAGGYVVKIHGSQYTSAGTPDLLACVNGWFYAFETKRPGEQPTRLQVSRLTEIWLAGGLGYVVESRLVVRDILGLNRTHNAIALAYNELVAWREALGMTPIPTGRVS